MRFFAAITKIDDEQRIVTGYASTEALDSQGEIIRREAMEAALPEYLKFGNIREMHQPSAVGVAVEAGFDDAGLKLSAHVVDPLAWEKVKTGVYKGFSIGGRVTARDKVEKHIITGLTLAEISLVDRPANPEAVFTVYKAEGVTEENPVDDAAKAAADFDAAAAALAKAQTDIQTAHDHMCTLGAVCDHATKTEMEGDLAKAMSVVQTVNETLAKVEAERDQALDKLAELTQQIETLKAQPAPTHAVLRTVEKAQDVIAAKPDSELEKRAETDPVAAAQLALKSPMVVMPIR